MHTCVILCCHAPVEIPDNPILTCIYMILLYYFNHMPKAGASFVLSCVLEDVCFELLEWLRDFIQFLKKRTSSH